MAQAHEKAAEEAWGSIDGTYHHIVKCACSALFEGEGRSAADAAIQAQDGYKIHLQG